MNKSKKITNVLIIILIFCAMNAVASEKTDDLYNRLELDLVSLYNPLGLSLAAEIYQRRIYRHDDFVLWDGLYVKWGAQFNINPAFSRAGLHMGWMPIAVLQMQAQYDQIYFSGSNGSLLTFTGSDQLFGEDELKAREGDEITGQGSRVLFNLTLRAKLGKTILRNVTDFIHYEFPGNGPYYLEREYEILMATTDDVVANKFFLLFDASSDSVKSSYAGPYHDYVQVRQAGLVRERLGITWVQEYASAFGVFHKPRWYLQSGVYLQDQNREDEFYLVFGFGGDLNF